MIPFPSRSVVATLVLTAGFGFARIASAEIAPATDTAHTDAQGRHIAPHDTFYVLEYVSARTDKGVEGFPPGTEVKLVKVNHEAHTLTVTDGHASVDLPPDKLTNDMDIAALVKAKDSANQERIAAYQKEQSEAYQKYQKEVADYTAKDLEKREKEIRDANNRAQEQANATRPQTTEVNTNASSNGYYNQGGNGYGSPYGYFVDLNPPVVVNGNTPARSTTGQTGNNSTNSSSQNTNQGGGAKATNGAVSTNGATSSGAGGSGGKKP